MATAGHVDHGKSSLVYALTGMQPDRWVEERRRGLTIDLGFAWTELPSSATVAFVDVPGHERFIGNMLAGVGAVPAVMFVVAADEGWSAQSAEHLGAIDAFGVRDGLLVVTKSDLADPESARRQALAEFAETSLGRVETCCVSAVTGAGLGELRGALDRLTTRLEVPAGDAPVRLWIDRAFTVAGAGTVVTGTLPAGTVRAGDELELAPADRRVTVRGLQSLERPCAEVTGPARVAINLRRVAAGGIGRGDALLTPDAWLTTVELDVLVDADLPREVRCHVGAAAVTARVRRLGPGVTRLRLASALPFHVGDRILLRVPGDRRICGAAVLDPRPAALGRRGAA
ncbi:MAG: selenocysteine-specific translation elongation factor, partial [Micromonosporaceae bacterium]